MSHHPLTHPPGSCDWDTCDWDTALQCFTPPSVPPPQTPPSLSLPFPLLSFILSVFSLWFPTPQWILGEPSRLLLLPLLLPASLPQLLFWPCFGSDWELSVTWGDPEMITPDEPWMCGNLTTMPYSREEPSRQGRRQAGRQAGMHPGLVLYICGFTIEPCCRACPGYHSRKTLCAPYMLWYTVKWISVPLHYWWDTLWCQTRRKERSKMTVSSVPHDHLCKQYRGLINCHPSLSAPVLTQTLFYSLVVNWNQSIYTSLFCPPSGQWE